MSIEKTAAAQIEGIVNEFLEYGIIKEGNDPLYVAGKQLFRTTWILGSIESALYSALWYCPEPFIDNIVASLQLSLNNLKDKDSVTKIYIKELDKLEEL